MVSIIIVNCNGLDNTCEVVDSFLLNETYPFEIIVVDSGSQPSRMEKLRQYCATDPQVKMAQNISSGFAGGSSTGLNVANGNYPLFISNDIYITQPTLEALVRRLGDKQDGGVFPMLKCRQYISTIRFAGFTPLTLIILRNHVVDEREPDDGQYSTPHETAYLHGATMMIRCDVLQWVGPINGVFFLSYEEMDQSVRIRRAGYRLWYEPASVIYHKEDMTAQRDTPLREFYMSRTRMPFTRGNLSGVNQTLPCLYIGLIATPKKAVTHLLHGRTSLTMAVLKGITHGMATGPH